MHRLTRTVLVTGASSGIGRAICRRLLANGHRVIGSSRDVGKFTQKHQHFIPLELDLSQADRAADRCQAIQQQYPQLNTVVFAAGFGRFASLEEFSRQQIEQLITVNFTAQVFITKALLPKLKQQPQANLIYIGSEAALQGSRKGTIYCASKFALRGFSQSLRDECGTSPVRVSLINPGMVRTPFFESLSFQPGTGKKQALCSDDIAEAVDYILSAAPQVAIDEINLNPVNKVIQFKK
jgi:NADP-dependent 3-hydroxy acid dehydrogenase YdfG